MDQQSQPESTPRRRVPQHLWLLSRGLTPVGAVHAPSEAAAIGKFAGMCGHGSVDYSIRARRADAPRD